MSTEFAMMDASGFMPYDSRAPESEHIPRAMPSYVVDAPYSAAPMPTLAASQYYQQHAPPMPYVAYQHSPQSSVQPPPPFRQDYERTMHREMGANHANRMAPFPRDSRQIPEVHMRSPPSRSASIASSAQSSSSNPTANFKNITYNETIDPSQQVEFDTDVDQLMRAVQQREDQAGTITPAPSPRPDNADPQSVPFTGQAAPMENKPKKKWVCDGPNCNKRFVQKTHLDIHRRTHTGARPYICPKPNCGLTFSQRGNLKTHVRRHTGEKPYSCSICGKLFAQRGNVRSHEETHKGLKPFVCRLDDCNKTFSQLGNMKTHQNNFHKDTLKYLTGSFLKFIESGDVPESHRELFDYFREHYKNSNKGVKGRGKDRAVAIRKPKKASTSRTTSISEVPHYTSAPSIASDDQDAYIVNSPIDTINAFPRGHEAPSYVIFGQEQGHPGSDDMLYNGSHRQMSFNERLY